MTPRVSGPRRGEERPRPAWTGGGSSLDDHVVDADIAVLAAVGDVPDPRINGVRARGGNRVAPVGPAGTAVVAKDTDARCEHGGHVGAVLLDHHRTVVVVRRVVVPVEVRPPADRLACCDAERLEEMSVRIGGAREHGAEVRTTVGGVAVE